MKTNINLIITPTLLKVLQEVSPEELDEALRKAFPRVFMSEVEQPKTELEEIRKLAVTKPQFDVVEYLREIRDADFIDGEPH